MFVVATDKDAARGPRYMLLNTETGVISNYYRMWLTDVEFHHNKGEYFVDHGGSGQIVVARTDSPVQVGLPTDEWIIPAMYRRITYSGGRFYAGDESIPRGFKFGGLILLDDKRYFADLNPVN
jgi:hypothetical protein